MLNDNKINRISLFSSVIAHLVLLIIFFISFPNPSEITSTIVPVPIEFSVKEIVIKKPTAPPSPTPPPAPTKPAKAPPTVYKDNRDKATVESNTDPYYPKEAINFSYEGTVVVNVLVNTQGRVADVTVVKSSGYTILDEAFIATIKSSYIFKPKRLNGVNLSDSVTLSYTFSL